MDGQIDAHAHKNNKKQHKKLKPAVLQMSTKARNEPWKGKGNNINRTRQHTNFLGQMLKSSREKAGAGRAANNSRKTTCSMRIRRDFVLLATETIVIHRQASMRCVR